MPWAVGIKFGENENPIEFIWKHERALDANGDHLSDSDRTEYVVRKFKGSAALWYTIMRDDIKTYDVIIKCFESRKLYDTENRNEHVQRKTRDRLEFGKCISGTLQGNNVS